MNSFKQPPWAKEIIERNRQNQKPQYEDQITIISRPGMGGGMGNGGGMGGNQSSAPMEPIAAMGMEFTGYGPDGKLQPDNPVDTVQTDNGITNLHEGELKILKPDGKTIVLDAIQSQEILKSLEEKGLVGGMQTGGEYEETDSLSTTKTDSTTPSGSTVMDTIGKYESGIDTGYQGLKDTATGGSDYQRQVAGETLRDYQMRSATELGKEQSILSGQTGLTDEAKQARTAELQRDSRMGAASLQADLAAQQKQAAEAANRELISQGVNVANYQQGVRKYEDQMRDTDWNRALLYYDPATPDGLKTLRGMYVQKFGGPAPDLNVLTEERNYARGKREQDIKLGDIGLTSAELDVKAKEYNLTSSKLIDAINAVKSGITDAVQLNGILGTSLSQDQVDNIGRDYKLSMDAKQFGLDASRLQTAINAINNGVTDAAQLNGILGSNLSQEQVNNIGRMYAAGARTAEAGATSAETAPLWTAYNASAAAGDVGGMAYQYQLITGGQPATNPDGTPQLDENGKPVLTGGVKLDTAQLEKARNLKNYDAIYDAVVNKGMSWYDVTSLGLLNAGQEGTQQWNEADKTYKTMKAIYDAKVASGAIDAATQATNAASSRINTLFLGGTGLEAMRGDATLRSNIASALGVGADDAAVDKEIETQWKAYLATNNVTFGGNVEQYLNIAWDNNKSVDDVLSDQTIWRNAAGYLGLDPNDEANRTAIETEIKSRYDQVTMPEIDGIIQNMDRSGLLEGYKDSPNWDGDLRQTIRDLQLKGVLDENGVPKPDAVFAWPWEDPDTYFNYTDWNGNDIEYAWSEDGVTLETVNGKTWDEYWAQPLNIDGNGTTYINPANGEPVNQGDAQQKWDSLMPMQREQYFSGGKPDTEKFVKDFFGVVSVDGQSPTIDPAAREDKLLTDDEYASALFAEKDEWTSGASYPASMAEKGLEGVIGPDNFAYYDQYGNLQVETKTSGKLDSIWMQLSDLYGENGQPLSAEDFGTIWNDGKGYVVDEDGTILNLTSDFQTRYDLSADNKFRMDITKLEPENASTTFSNFSVTNTGIDFGEETAPDSSYKQRISGTGEGVLTRWISGDSRIYDLRNNGATFNDGFKAWLNNNMGKQITYNGKTYTIVSDGQEPIVHDYLFGRETSGSYGYDFKGDGLRVLDENGNETVLTFGTHGNLED